MPKRHCPFTESNRPQLKTHIGLRELSTGVMGLETLSDVYDRTLKLMYQNSNVSRTAHKENMTIDSDSANDKKSGTACTQQHILPGQRKLNFLGQLDGYYSSGGLQCPTKDQFIPIACSACSNIPSMAKTCNFCERCLCEMCCRGCHVCESSFCSDCSTIRYKPGEGDKYLCLNCV